MSETNTLFLQQSQRFWQKRTDRPLSDEDARQIVANVTGLFRLLAEWAATEDQRQKGRPRAPISAERAGFGAGGRR